MPGRAGYHDVVSIRTLTPRQREVLELVAKGRTNGEIATGLGIGFDTVKTHVSEILGRLGVESREEAAAVWRSEQSVFSRLRRTATGFFLSTVGRVAAGLTATAVAVGIAAAMVIAGQGDSDSDPLPAASSVTPESVATPAATSSPLTAPTVDLLNTIAGKPIGEITLTGPVELPDGMVMLFNDVCYGCDGGFNLKIAYITVDGSMRIVSRMPEEALSVEPRTSLDGFSQEGLGTMFALICTGFCGGYDEPTPGSTRALWRSVDGGVTWTRLRGEIPPVSYIAGQAGGEALIGQSASSAANPAGAIEFVWYPSGRKESPPSGPGPYEPEIGADGSVSWLSRPAYGSNSPLEYIEPGGLRRSIAPPNDDRLRWESVMNPRLTQQRIWTGSFREGGAGEEYLAFTDDATGTLISVHYFPRRDLRVTRLLNGKTFLGGADLADPWSPNQFSPVIVDLSAGTMSPIRSFSPGDNGRKSSIPIDVIMGTPRVVATGDGDCLNVRQEASASSASLGCFAEGVLLMEVEGSTAQWRHVRTPGGEVGWAAAEFLD